MHVDAIEKELLYHFHPGARVLRPGFLTPSSVVAEAQSGGAQCVAVPADPGPHVPKILAALRTCRESGLLTLGSITAQAATEGDGVDLAALDAATIDLAGSMKTSRLQATLDRLRKIVEQTTTWIELVVRVVHGQTDSHHVIDDLSRAIRGVLGPDVPVHFDGLDGQIGATSYARWIAASSGLHWVYTSSADDANGRNTWCPDCDAQLVARAGASATFVRLAGDACSSCGRLVPGRFVKAPVETLRAVVAD